MATEEPTAPATGNVKMKRVCFRTKRVCFSSENVGVVFSLSLEVTVSALFCILMDNPWYTKGFSIRDILHAMLEEEEISFVSNKTWYIYRLLRKYCTAWEHHIYRPTDLRRVYRKTAITVDWLVG